jgi:hypothetical protein
MLASTVEHHFSKLIGEKVDQIIENSDNCIRFLSLKKKNTIVTLL